MIFIPLVVLAIILLILIFSLSTIVFVVKQQTVAIVERFGKYQFTANPGFHLKLPWGIDRIAARVQLRLLQIKAYIEDALRSAVPKLTLDDVFEKKDEIALEVQKTVAEEMQTYGYIIVKTLITKVEPDAEVKQSMNEINAAQRKQDASQMLANANKIQVVTAAEAEAEKDRLHGVGIAEQRKAIVDGLAQQITEIKKLGVALDEEQIMAILLTNQYLDTLNQFAAGGNSTIFLPSGAEGAESLRTQILSAIKAGK